MAHPVPAQSQSHAPGPHGDGGDHHPHEAHHVNYIKIYFILVGLLLVSVAGPEIGIRAVTLFTAFGIALIKAYIVAANFMHLKFEKKYVAYLMFTALAFMALFFAGTSADVMMHRGRNWENKAANAETERALKAEHEHHEQHGEPH